MQTTATVKLGAAFLAGIFVALGGAVVYFHAAAGQVQTPPLQVRLPEPDAPAADPASKPAASEPAPAPSIVAQAPTPVQAVKPVVKRVKHVLRRNNDPVSLAVSTPPLPVQQPLSLPVEPPPSTPAPTVAVPPQPHTVTIPAGTSLTVRLNETLSTQHNYVGDTFRASLDAPIVMNGFIIADRGAKVLGRVVKAQKPGKLEGMAELSLVLTQVSTTDGQTVGLQTNESLRKGPSNTSEEVIKMAGGAALGAIIGAIAGGGKGAAIGAGAGGAAGTGAVLLGRGKPAVINSETRLTFELANDTTITERLNLQN